MPSSSSPALHSSRPLRILLIQLRRIGDVLLTTPAVRALRARWPHAQIDYLTEAPAEQLFLANPHLDRVLLVAPKARGREYLRLIRRLRAAHYDVALDFFGNPRAALLTGFCGAPRRIGFAFRGRRWAYTDAITIPVAPPLRYSAEDKLLLARALGAEEKELGLVFPLTAELRSWAQSELQARGWDPRRLLVALCPFSRLADRLWPPERYARFADALIERYQAQILLLYGPGENPLADLVRAQMRYAALPDLPVRTLPHLAALLAEADLYLGNDTGPRHFAIARGTPTLTPFGRYAHPENWTPPGCPQHRWQYNPLGIERIPYEALEREFEALLPWIESRRSKKAAHTSLVETE